MEKKNKILLIVAPIAAAFVITYVIDRQNNYGWLAPKREFIKVDTIQYQEQVKDSLEIDTTAVKGDTK